jgi:hypothetical protein
MENLQFDPGGGGQLVGRPQGQLRHPSLQGGRPFRPEDRHQSGLGAARDWIAGKYEQFSLQE